MKVFLSHSSEETELASRIALALRDAGDELFFDRLSLPAGETYDRRIQEAIESCDLFVFLLTPRAILPGTYSLAEVAIAERSSEIHVLPVTVSPTNHALLPPFLRAVTLLEPKGDIVAETLAVIANVRSDVKRRQIQVNLEQQQQYLHIRFTIYPVREIFYRFGDQAPFRSTGFAPLDDALTGLPYPNLFVVVPLAEVRPYLQYKYVDEKGREHGPFTCVVDAAVHNQAMANAKWLLEMSRPWVPFIMRNDGVLMAFLKPLALCRDALREIHYSIDNDSLSARRDFSEELPEFIEVPNNTVYVLVKLVFIDGTESEAERCLNVPKA